MLTHQEESIWNTALSHYSKTEMAAAISQVSDLAQAEFLATMEGIRGNPEYSDKIEREGLIYAKYLLTEYAIKFTSQG